MQPGVLLRVLRVSTVVIDRPYPLAIDEVSQRCGKLTGSGVSGPLPQRTLVLTFINDSFSGLCWGMKLYGWSRISFPSAFSVTQAYNYKIGLCSDKPCQSEKAIRLELKSRVLSHQNLNCIILHLHRVHMFTSRRNDSTFYGSPDVSVGHNLPGNSGQCPPSRSIASATKGSAE